MYFRSLHPCDNPNCPYQYKSCDHGFIYPPGYIPYYKPYIFWNDNINNRQIKDHFNNLNANSLEDCLIFLKNQE